MAGGGSSNWLILTWKCSLFLRVAKLSLFCIHDPFPVFRIKSGCLPIITRILTETYPAPDISGTHSGLTRETSRVLPGFIPNSPWMCAIRILPGSESRKLPGSTPETFGICPVFSRDVCDTDIPLEQIPETPGKYAGNFRDVLSERFRAGIVEA